MEIDFTNLRQYYKIYYIKKPNGKLRKICESKEPLKSLQKELKCKLENIPVHKYSYGFVKGKGIADVCKQHVRKEWVLSMDIKDFFPSCKKSMINFLSDEEEKIAFLDEELCTGSPASPTISNLCFIPVLERLEILEKLGYTITSYVDNIDISSNIKISKKKKHQLVKFITDTCAICGFRINVSKTKFMPKGTRQTVLGLIVNDKVNILRKKNKELRLKRKHSDITEKEIGYLSYINSFDKELALKLG